MSVTRQLIKVVRGCTCELNKVQAAKEYVMNIILSRYGFPDKIVSSLLPKILRIFNQKFLLSLLERRLHDSRNRL